MNLRYSRRTGDSNISTGTAILRLTLVMMWISGFVIAKGFVSTLACIIPFWAWYLTIEKVLQVAGII